MESEWRDITLGELCVMRAGSTFPPAFQGKRTGKYPFIKVSDMNLPENTISIYSSNNWVDDEDVKRLSLSPFPKGTVVFAKIGEAIKQNRLRQIKKPTIIDNNMMGAIPNPEIVDPLFFYFLLSQIDFGEIAQGSALPFLSLQVLNKVIFRVPPLAEQRRIAGILGAFDDKIELNRRMNATLEAMARALFQSWFVDFDPVRAKMDGRWRQGESLPGLPAAWWHLFPDRLVDSELGPIPEGWRVGTLGEVADVNWGDTNTTKASYEKEGYPAFSASGFDGYLPYFDYDHEAVVVSAIGANAGRTWLTYGKWSCIKNTIRFWATEESLSTEYLYLSTYGKDTWAIRGSAQPFISQGDSRAKKIIIPTNFLGSYFGKNVSPLFHRIFSNLKENATLGDYRDSLLPVLVSFKK